MWPVSWCKVSVRRRPKRPVVANLRSGRKRFPWSRKKPPKHGVIRKRPASRKAPHQKAKKGFLQLAHRAKAKVNKKPATRCYTPPQQQKVQNPSLRETRRVASKASVTLEDIWSWSDTQLTLKLLNLGFLAYRRKCPLCKGPLSDPQHKKRRQRCQSKKCHNWVTLWTQHPIFSVKGSSLSLRTQAAILLFGLKTLAFRLYLLIFQLDNPFKLVTL